MMEEKSFFEFIEADDEGGWKEFITSINQHKPSSVSAKTGHQLLCKLIHSRNESQLEHGGLRRLYQTMVYAICHKTKHLDYIGENGETILEKAATCGCGLMCEILLQCGANMHVLHQGHIKLVDAVLADGNEEFSEGVKRAFLKYKPGLYEAVKRQSITDVRVLVNSWCRTDIHIDLPPAPSSLIEEAFKSKHDGIIRLLRGIGPSMQLVHAVLADDVATVHHILSLHKMKEIVINFKNMGSGNTTMLHVAILNHNPELVRILLERGSSLTSSVISGHPEEEYPIVFDIVRRDVSVSVVRAVVAYCTERRMRLCDVLYKGRSLLRVAIERNLCLEVISLILESGLIRFITHRDKNNETCRDMASNLGRIDIVSAIDDQVYRWVCDSDSDVNRKMLALEGYDHIMDVTSQDGDKLSDTSDDVAEYLSHLETYQHAVEDLFQALADGDNRSFKQRLTFKSHHFYTDLTLAKRKGCGQPLLHLAVLLQHVDIVSVLVSVIPVRLDTILDQYERTGLHYACGLNDGGVIEQILLDSGCSELVEDVDGRMPVDFRKFRTSQYMSEILHSQLVMSSRSALDEEVLWQKCEAEQRQLQALEREDVQNLSWPDFHHGGHLNHHHAHNHDHHNHAHDHHNHAHDHHNHAHDHHAHDHHNHDHDHHNHAHNHHNHAHDHHNQYQYQEDTTSASTLSQSIDFDDHNALAPVTNSSSVNFCTLL